MKYQSDKILKYRNKLNDFLNEGDNLSNIVNKKGGKGKTVGTIVDLYNDIIEQAYGFVMTEYNKTTNPKSNEQLKESFKSLLIKHDLYKKTPTTSADVNTILKKVCDILNNPFTTVMENASESENEMIDIIHGLLGLKTINDIIKKYNAKVGGFFIEEFIGSIFDMNMNKSGNEDNDTTDTTIDVFIHNIPYSIKLLGSDNPRKTDIEGSLKYLVNTINKPAGKVVYLVIIKNNNTLSFYSKEIDRGVVLNVLMKDYEKFKTMVKIDKNNNLFVEIPVKKNNDNEEIDSSNNYNEEIDSSIIVESGPGQFKISQSFFKKMAGEPVAIIDLNASRFANKGDEFKKILEKIQDKVIPLYTQLDDFNISLYKYFGSTDENIEANSEKLKTSAKKIPERTTEVIDVTKK